MSFVSTFTGICSGRFLCLVVPQQPGCLQPHPGLEVAQAAGWGGQGLQPLVGQSLTPFLFFPHQFSRRAERRSGEGFLHCRVPRARGGF